MWLKPFSRLLGGNRYSSWLQDWKWFLSGARASENYSRGGWSIWHGVAAFAPLSVPVPAQMIGHVSKGKLTTLTDTSYFSALKVLFWSHFAFGVDIICIIYLSQTVIIDVPSSMLCHISVLNWLFGVFYYEHLDICPTNIPCFISFHNFSANYCSMLFLCHNKIQWPDFFHLTLIPKKLVKHGSARWSSSFTDAGKVSEWKLQERKWNGYSFCSKLTCNFELIILTIYRIQLWQVTKQRAWMIFFKQNHLFERTALFIDRLK